MASHSLLIPRIPPGQHLPPFSFLLTITPTITHRSRRYLRPPARLRSLSSTAATSSVTHTLDVRPDYCSPPTARKSHRTRNLLGTCRTLAAHSAPPTLVACEHALNFELGRERCRFRSSVYTCWLVTQVADVSWRSPREHADEASRLRCCGDDATARNVLALRLRSW